MGVSALRGWVGSLLAAWAAASAATGVERLSVDRDGASYTVDTAVVVEASPADLRVILTDPALLPALNHRVRGVEALERAGPHGQRVRIESRRCVLVFCRDYRWVQSARVDGAGDVRVTLEPGEGSVRGGHILYRLDGVSPTRTRLLVSARVEPGVTLPPLIGPALMRSALADDMAVWSESISRVAASLRRPETVAGARVAQPRPPAAPAACTRAAFC